MASVTPPTTDEDDTDWYALKSEKYDGREYYFNPKTNETTWILPDDEHPNPNECVYGSPSENADQTEHLRNVVDDDATFPSIDNANGVQLKRIGRCVGLLLCLLALCAIILILPLKEDQNVLKVTNTKETHIENSEKQDYEQHVELPQVSRDDKRESPDVSSLIEESISPAEDTVDQGNEASEPNESQDTAGDNQQLDAEDVANNENASVRQNDEGHLVDGTIRDSELEGVDADTANNILQEAKEQKQDGGEDRPANSEYSRSSSLQPNEAHSKPDEAAHEDEIQGREEEDSALNATEESPKDVEPPSLSSTDASDIKGLLEEQGTPELREEGMTIPTLEVEEETTEGTSSDGSNAMRAQSIIARNATQTKNRAEKEKEPAQEVGVDTDDGSGHPVEIELDWEAIRKAVNVPRNPGVDPKTLSSPITSGAKLLATLEQHLENLGYDIERGPDAVTLKEKGTQERTRKRRSRWFGGRALLSF